MTERVIIRSVRPGRSETVPSDAMSLGELFERAQQGALTVSDGERAMLRARVECAARLRHISVDDSALLLAAKALGVI